MAAVGTVEIAGIGCSCVGDDVGVVGTGDQDRDTQHRTARSRPPGIPPTAPRRPSLRNTVPSRACRAPRLRSTPRRCGPRPASRITGSSALVSATGPNTVVANILSHRLIGVSSAIPAAEMPALCTRAYGAPTASSIDFAAASTDAESVRSSATPISRGSPSAAPVAARSLSIPASTDRIAATTCQPRLYNSVADASPRPLEAPVMTTLRGSAIRGFGRTSVSSWSPTRRRVDRRAVPAARSTTCRPSTGPLRRSPRSSPAGRTPWPRGMATGRRPRWPARWP